MVVPGVRYALRFLTGKYAGVEFPLRDGREYLIGRMPESDVVLADDRVSRWHARLSWDRDQLVVRDAGSCGGMYLNGAKFREAPLQVGDRLQIGGSLIKLVAADPRVDLPEDWGAHAASVEQSPADSGLMRDSFDDVSLADLLQLLSIAKRTGVLTVSGSGGRGRIFLKKGRIVHVDDEAPEGAALQPTAREALFAMLRWEVESYDLSQSGQPIEEPPMSFTESTEALLTEADVAAGRTKP